MARFIYKARDSEGKTVSGFVETANLDSAASILHNQHFFIIALGEEKKLTQLLVPIKFKRVGFGDTVNFTRQLATMVVAGLSLPDSLTILRTQTTNPAFAKVLGDIERQIVGGGNLADSVGKYPNIFSPIYVSLVRAGEASGNLDKVLTRLADNLERQREFKNKVVSAMIYPIIVLAGMVVMMIVMMVVVIPKLKDLYSDFGVSLPWSTQILIGMSNLLFNYWWLLIILVVGTVFLFRQWRKTPPGEFFIDSLILKIPIIGELQKKMILVEFTRTLALLIGSGIHILDGLRILKGSLSNVVFRQSIDTVSGKIEKGSPLGDSFAQEKEFPPIVSQMMKVGEETGKIDDTLNKLSNYFETESDQLVRGLTAAIEPLIMIVLGIGVGFIVISIITPIYNLTNQIK